MTNAALVARKLAVLEDHLRRLKSRRPPTREAFEADLLLQDAVAMSLLVVVQDLDAQVVDPIVRRLHGVSDLPKHQQRWAHLLRRHFRSLAPARLSAQLGRRTGPML